MTENELSYEDLVQQHRAVTEILVHAIRQVGTLTITKEDFSNAEDASQIQIEDTGDAFEITLVTE